MKKLNLSLAAIFAMGTFAVAGGDIAPVEPVVEEPVVESTGNFYLGLAYSYLNDNVTLKDYNGLFPGNNLGAGASLDLWDWDHSDIMLQAGYNFNDYIAIEARYWIGLSDTNVFLNTNVDTSVDAFGIYVKPQYTFDAFRIYALLGYGTTDYQFDVSNNAWKNSFATDNDDGFSWGLGASYAFTDNVSVFIDYVSIYNDNKDYADASTGLDINLDRTVDTWNFGVTYNF